MDDDASLGHKPKQYIFPMKLPAPNPADRAIVEYVAGQKAKAAALPSCPACGGKVGDDPASPMRIAHRSPCTDDLLSTQISRDRQAQLARDLGKQVKQLEEENKALLRLAPPCPYCGAKCIEVQPGYEDPVGPNGECQYYPTLRFFSCGRAEWESNTGWNNFGISTDGTCEEQA